MENKNNNLNLQISNEWKNTFPGATVGLLVIKNTINPQKSSALDNEMKNVTCISEYSVFDQSKLIRDT